MQKKPMQNELNNQNHGVSTHEDDHIKSQIKILQELSPEELNFKVQKLNYLCIHFDPFDFQNQSTEVENILKEFELEKYDNNPFLFTKVVLRLIDAGEQITNKRVN